MMNLRNSKQSNRRRNRSSLYPEESSLKNISRPFPVDKVKYVQQLKGNEYETRNNEHSVLHSEDETSEKR